MNSIRFTLAAAALIGLSACGTMPKPAAWTSDETLARHASAAARSQAQGSVAEAAKQYARALQRARALDDAEGVAVMAYNLATCEYELGNLNRAKLRIAEIRATAPAYHPAALRLLEARVALAEGRLDDADAASKLEKSEPPLHGNERAVDAVVRASIEQARGRNEDALQILNGAQGLIASASLSLQAEAEELRAEISAQNKASADAADAWERAASLWSRAGQSGPVAEALAAAAASRSDAGDDARALELEYRAARAAHASGRDRLARKLLESAQRRPDAAEGGPWKPLLDELRASLPAPAPSAPTAPAKSSTPDGA